MGLESGLAKTERRVCASAVGSVGWVSQGERAAEGSRGSGGWLGSGLGLGLGLGLKLGFKRRESLLSFSPMPKLPRL